MSANIMDLIVNRGFCIGCGTCAGVCPANNLKMVFNLHGEYQPIQLDKCAHNCGLCVQCCPRSPGTISIDVIAEQNYGAFSGIKYTFETGYYLKCYEGYSDVNGHRENGASGGLTTWFLEQLLSQKKVTGVACVKRNQDSEKLFSFFIAETVEELRASASSAYYPVEMSSIIRDILKKKEGIFAVIGVPCFLTALSLAERQIPRLKKKIGYKIGLVCSRLPSKNYVKYFSDHLKINANAINKVRFRDKSVYPSKLRGTRLQTSTGKIYNVNNRMDFIWSSGKVSPTACMFCDDVFAEVADVVFMDAWVPGHEQEHYGVSLTLIRNPEVTSIFDIGQITKQLQTKSVDVKRIIASQKGRLENKREQLMYRIYLAEQWGIVSPPIKRGHKKIKLTILKKIKTIIVFYNQQITHKSNIPTIKRLIPFILLSFNDLWDIIRKIKNILKYGKNGGAVTIGRK